MFITTSKKNHYSQLKKYVKEIFDTAENLKHHPEIYPLDKYRKNNNGSIRSFEVYSYRIAYQVTKSEIRILRVRHTRREPLEY